MHDPVTRVLECPRCGATLAPPRFARSVVCSYCETTVQVDPSVVSAAMFRQKLAAWNSPEAHGYANYLSIDGKHWEVHGLVARGEISDVYFAQRARWPSERVLLKVLREPAGAPLFKSQWEVLEKLAGSEVQGAAVFTTLIPQPVMRGTIDGGLFRGRQALVFRWASGFVHTLEGVRQTYPRGIDPQISIWMWRRILELLSFLHRSGVVHGEVVPPHLLVEDGEHGIRLVGYSTAGEPGAKRTATCDRFFHFDSSKRLSPADDIKMSARTIAFVLGAEGACIEPPASVPGPLADLIRKVAIEGSENAWSIREKVGKIARGLYGPPSFHPLPMPS